MMTAASRFATETHCSFFITANKWLAAENPYMYNLIIDGVKEKQRINEGKKWNIL